MLEVKPVVMNEPVFTESADTFYIDTLKVDGIIKHFEYSGWEVKEGVRAIFLYNILNVTSDTLGFFLTSSCGCLIGEFENKPLSPKESMKVKYTLLTQGRPGNCQKTMVIKYWNYGIAKNDWEIDNQDRKKISGSLIGRID